MSIGNFQKAFFNNFTIFITLKENKIILHRARSWSCLYEPPRLLSKSTDLPARSRTHVIQQLRTSSLAAVLKCEHRTYEPNRSYTHTRAS